MSNILAAYKRHQKEISDSRANFAAKLKPIWDALADFHHLKTAWWHGEFNNFVDWAITLIKIKLCQPSKSNYEPKLEMDINRHNLRMLGFTSFSEAAKKIQSLSIAFAPAFRLEMTPINEHGFSVHFKIHQ